MHPFFAVLEAKVVHVPDANRAALETEQHFAEKGQATIIEFRGPGRVYVEPNGLEGLLFVTDPTTTWDKVRLA